MLTIIPKPIMSKTCSFSFYKKLHTKGRKLRDIPGDASAADFSGMLTKV